MTPKGTILVVDDTPAILKLLVDTLTADGYQVRPADSGELALAAVAARPPELILLDIRMPGLDGLEVCRRLKARTESQDIPIIFISAFGESAERVEGLKLGAVDFIAKPIQLTELLARVHTHLELRRLRVRSEQQAANLQRTNERLQGELAERQRSAAAALALSQEIQASYHATLNLMDDAVEARGRLETTNERLRGEIAERQRAEQTLAALSARQEAILAAVPDIIMEVDNRKVYTWANRAGLTFFGDDVIGKEAEFFFEGEQTTYQAVQPLFDGQQDLIYVESWQRRQDGKKRLLAWRCRVLKDEKGNVTGALSSAWDVTEQREAEAARHQAEERYRSIFENALEGIFQTTPQGTFLALNPAMARIFGYESPEAFIRERTDIARQGYVDPRCREEFARRIEADGTVIGFEYEAYRRDGSKIWVSESARVVRDAHGQMVCYEGSLEDITPRKRDEVALAGQLDELRRWHDAMVGRETRVIELKQQVNEVLARLGEPPRYPSALAGAEQRTEDGGW